jgi:hypothetical protein
MSPEPLVPSVVRGYRAVLRRPVRHSHADITNIRCPKCESPLAPRMGPRGPYFHCHCTRREP